MLLAVVSVTEQDGQDGKAQMPAVRPVTARQRVQLPVSVTSCRVAGHPLPFADAVSVTNTSAP